MALYERRKGRDLFDLAFALKNEAVAPDRVTAAFSAYMEHGEDAVVSRALFIRVPDATKNHV